jgi:hypoxanthine phosphoribosyltransferase
MPRHKPTPTRDVLEIDWALFGELCRALAVHVSRGYRPDLVVGIAKAGVIPAAIIASILQVEFASMVIGRRQEGDAPELVAGPPPTVHGRRVLLVDETCDTGDTIKLALNALQVAAPADVRTAVSFRTGPYQPDFQAFETAKAIVLPWDREIIIDGNLVTRPDLREWLAE